MVAEEEIRASEDSGSQSFHGQFQPKGIWRNDKTLWSYDCDLHFTSFDVKPNMPWSKLYDEEAKWIGKIKLADIRWMRNNFDELLQHFKSAKKLVHRILDYAMLILNLI